MNPIKNIIGFLVGLVIGYKGIPILWHLIYLGVIIALSLIILLKIIA